jgi:hypothetical protein
VGLPCVGRVGVCGWRVWDVQLVREEWMYDDFFSLSTIDEHALKKLIAKKLDLSYGDVTAVAWAHSVQGVPAFDPVALQTRWTKYKTERDTIPTEQVGIDKKTKAWGRNDVTSIAMSL